MKKSEKKMRVEMISLKEIKELGLQYHPQNREIVENHVKQIKEFITNELNNGDDPERIIGTMGTIIVSIKTRNLLDGQHRIEACMKLLEEGILNKSLELPFQWVWCNDLTSEYEQIKNYNNRARKWTSYDYFRGNKIVNDNYKRLESFIKECPKLRGKNSTRPAYALLFGKSYNRKDFNDGKFTMTEKDRQRGLKMYSEIETLLVYIKNPKKVSTFGMAPRLNFEEFTCAWYNFRMTVGKDIVFDDFVDEIRTHEKSYNNMSKMGRIDFSNMFDRALKKMISRKDGRTVRI